MKLAYTINSGALLKNNHHALYLFRPNLSSEASTAAFEPEADPRLNLSSNVLCHLPQTTVLKCALEGRLEAQS